MTFGNVSLCYKILSRVMPMLTDTVTSKRDGNTEASLTVQIASSLGPGKGLETWTLEHLQLCRRKQSTTSLPMTPPTLSLRRFRQHSLTLTALTSLTCPSSSTSAESNERDVISEEFNQVVLCPLQRGRGPLAAAAERTGN